LALLDSALGRRERGMGQDKPDLADLFRRWREGHKEAVAKLYEECRGALLMVARSQLSSYRPPRITEDDAVQEAMTRLLELAPDRPIDNLMPYLMQVIRNHIIGVHRKPRRREEPLLEDDPVEDRGPTPSTPLQEEEEREESKRKLDRCYSAIERLLSPSERYCYPPWKRGERPAAELARETGYTLAAFYVKMKRAEQRIRVALGIRQD
jgi:RNA polymerase sigma factor (sigma-70 family)